MPDRLPYFPTPYPDELFYSTVARYHENSPNGSGQQTMHDLYGCRAVRPMIEFPCRLGALSERLSPRTVLTPDYLVRRHTLLPYYQPFITAERYADMVSRMSSSNVGGNIHYMLGLSMSRLTRLSQFDPDFGKIAPFSLCNQLKSQGQQGKNSL